MNAPPRRLAAASSAGAIVLLAIAATLPDSAPSDAPIPDDVRRRLLSMRRGAALAPDSTNRVADDADAANLGQRLFFEPRLSRNGEVSCATCHLPERGFTDGRQRGVGLSEGVRNTQGLLDIADLPWFTWDGRADSLWSQALHPFEDSREMGMPRAELIERVRSIDELRREYEKVFGPLPSPASSPADGAAGVPGPATESIAINRAFANIGKAIAAYERRLRTGPGAFDRELARIAAGESAPADRSDAAASEPIDGFGETERRGMLLFAGRAGCWRCHHGPSLSDGSFHSIGVPPLSGELPHDRGRFDAIARLQASPFNAAGAFSDDPAGMRGRLTLSLVAEPSLWGAVRTPSLRNVSKTAPYMHEGQFESLERVVRFYSTLEGALADHHGERVLEPLGLSDQEIADLVAFLRSLDGAPPAPPLLSPPKD